MLRQLSRRYVQIRNQQPLLSKLYSSTASPTAQPENEESKKEISKAMKAYLERAREHDNFMLTEQQKYNIGKRHLANMMGENPETFTQEDIDEAIAYLFPSGLFEKKARPVMKPPEEIFPQRKAAEFNEMGRPHHFLFYTSTPNFYKVLYDVVENMDQCYKFEDVLIRKNSQPDPNLKLQDSGYQWLDKLGLEKLLVETITDRQYATFTSTMERLFALPCSYKVRDFIEKYRRPLMSQTKTLEIPEPKYDANGRAYVTTYECLRKRARGHVTVWSPGQGRVSINGQDINYFEDMYCREQILFPMIFTNLHTKVDVEAYVENGGPAGQAGAIRWGISMGLRSFVDAEMVEKMRIAGLLSRDYRTRERKKPGQAGARKKYTWKKR